MQMFKICISNSLPFGFWGTFGHPSGWVFYHLLSLGGRECKNVVGQHGMGLMQMELLYRGDGVISAAVLGMDERF